MRKKIVAGNWKMNKTVEEGLALAMEIKDLVSQDPALVAEVIICPPFTHLYAVATLLKESNLHAGAQNCAAAESGAFTGEVSAGMIASAGAEYIIIGHSERRAIFGEDDNIINQKVNTALRYGMKIIFCCGETLPERESGNHFSVVEKQIKGGIFSLDEDSIKNIIIAYEPVWAIGTGVTATSQQAQEMHQFIRKIISGKYGSEIGGMMTILYGGSCNPANARELFSMDDVDGGLIGGASLKAADFNAIIKSF